MLLVHGIVDNRSIFVHLARVLRRRGHGTVQAVNYSPMTAFTGDIRAAARDLGEHVERLCAVSGVDRVHVIGHSLGGLIARYYVQRLGGDARVDTLVTLGTPHQGSHIAHLLPPTVVPRQLLPGSDLLRELDRARPGLPHPVPRGVEPHGPADHPAAQRPPRAPRPAGDERPRSTTSGTWR